MKTNFNKHLLGIFKILKNRFDYINNSIGHNLTTGEENEAEIRKLLVEFLPSNYGIGSGIIVDIEGKQSKQVDIIIYDKSTPNYSFSKDSKIFLLDQVLATIEIKTSITTGKDGSLADALENVRSIKQLKPSPLTWVEDTLNIEEDSKQNWKVSQFSPSSPVCIIFFYKIAERKSAIDLDKFFISLESELLKIEKRNQPDLLFSFEHSAFYRVQDIGSPGEGQFHLCLLNLNDNPSSPVTITGVTSEYKALINFGNFIFTDDSFVNAKYINNNNNSIKVIALEGDELVLDPIVYKTGTIKNEIYYIDSYRGFMNFIFSIDSYLRVKKTNKNNFISSYFPKDFFMLTNYKDGLEFTEEKCEQSIL